MRMRIIAIGILLLLSAALTAAVQNGNDLYQQGLARETAGDIKGAIQIFERIVRDYSSNRTLTAKALVQLGRWSDLLGQDQARKYYERVTQEFAGQKEAAAEARARLEVLTKVDAPGASAARRLVVDWADWKRRTGGAHTRLTRDGRHVLRYDGEQRAFELLDVGTGDVRRLTSDGPDPAEVMGSGGITRSELSPDGRRVAAMAGVQKPQPAAELRLFEVGGRGPGRVLARWEAQTWYRVQPFAWAPGNDRIWLFIIRNDQ